MAHSARVQFETLRTLAFGSIGAAYTAVGTPLEESAQIIIVNNTTGDDLLFSIDGTTDHFMVAAGSGLVLDLSTNREETLNAFYLSKGTTLYVKEINGSQSGAVYFSVIY